MNINDITNVEEKTVRKAAGVLSSKASGKKEAEIVAITANKKATASALKEDTT